VNAGNTHNGNYNPANLSALSEIYLSQRAKVAWRTRELTLSPSVITEEGNYCTTCLGRAIRAGSIEYTDNAAGWMLFHFKAFWSINIILLTVI